MHQKGSFSLKFLYNFDMKVILRVFGYLKKYPLLALAQVCCALLATLAVIVFPQVTKHIINNIVAKQLHKELWLWVALALGGFFLRDACNAWRILLNNIFEQKVIFDIRSDLYGRLQQLSVEWFDKRRSGDIMTRVIEDVTAMERVLIDGIEQGLIAVVQICAVSVILWSMDTRVAAWASLPLPFLICGAWLYTKNAAGRYKAQRNAASAVNSVLHDNIAGIRQIKCYAQEQRELQRFNNASDSLRQATLGVMRYWAAYNPGMSFIASLGYIAVLGFGGQAVMEGRLNYGEWVQYFLLLHLLYDPIGKLHHLNQMFLGGRAAAARVFSILDTPKESHADHGLELQGQIRGEVEFCRVNFSYGDTATLQDINLQAKAGQTIALVGASGAGKSTLLSLLCRFYEVSSGKILIDGKDIAEINKSQLRAQLGYVTQEAFLFNGTVRENMLFARPQASEAQIIEALQAANAWEFVSALPQALDSNVGERGIKLSGGEKQRLSIARALLKNPPILLLDEATASVDSRTELAIQQSLERLMQNRTAFVIAHRLSTIRSADCIYVFDKGRIVECGKHEHLLKMNNYYARLCQRSFLQEEQD